jgi:hypothetical protein
MTSTRLVAITSVVNAHAMRSRGKSGFQKPIALTYRPRFLSPLPKSVCTTILDANWRSVMQVEYDAIMANNTWTLVPRPVGVNIVTGKWVYHRMFLVDGSLDCYKSR